MKLLEFFVVLCWVMIAGGAPVSQEEITPCLHRRNQVLNEMHTNETITTEPRYLPQCESNGVKWEPTQCTHIDGPSCFCVDPDTGIPQPGTRVDPFSTTSKDLNCDPRPCQHMLNQYLAFTHLNPFVADAPFGYEPSCKPDGRFEAMQRHAFHFFCVDTVTGETVPDTNYEPGVGKPITDEICQEYSDLWQKYKIWLEENEMEELDDQYVKSNQDQTCPQEFEFHLCSCKNLCTPGSNMTDGLRVCDYCKPVCRCQDGFYEYNKTCVTNDVCIALQPEPFTLDIKETLWNTYMLLNSNDILKSHWEADDDEDLKDIFSVRGNSPTPTNPASTPQQSSTEASAAQLEEEEEAPNQNSQNTNPSSSTSTRQETSDNTSQENEVPNRLRNQQNETQAESQGESQNNSPLKKAST